MPGDDGKTGRAKGHVYLVGAGPGPGGLITVRGLELLRSCDTLVYDRLCGEELLAETDFSCERIYVGKKAGCHSMEQEEINRLLVSKANEGRKVVRLKGGDPFVFGRGGEEAEYLAAAQIPYTIVPGVTSAVAAPELAGIPVTHRGLSRSFHVITAHTGEKEPAAVRRYLDAQIRGLKDAEGTFVFLMGLSVLDSICELLLQYGRAPACPAAVISGGGRFDELVIRGTVADIAGRAKREGAFSPAVIVVGEAAALSLLADNSGPLQGVCVGMTGTAELQEKLGRYLRKAGAKTVCVQELWTQACAEQEQYFRELAVYTWIVFTSASGVRLFFEEFRKRRLDIRKLAGVRIAVIGGGTADKLQSYGFFADFMPDTYTAKALAEGLMARLDPVADRVLLYQAQEGNPVLEKRLQNAGVAVRRANAYVTKAGFACHSDLLRTLAYLTFASSSGVKAFCGAYPHIFAQPFMRGLCCVAIGVQTARALEEAGCQNIVTARSFTAQGLAEAVAEHERKKRR